MKKFIVVVGLLIVGLSIYYFWPEPMLLPDTKIDKIVVRKGDREMHVFSKGKLLKTYSVSLGRNPVGDKREEGDKRTPEGRYIIDSKNPGSGYHKNLGISYPNKEDKAVSRKDERNPGGEIKIHGLRNGQGFIGKFQRWTDWTAGCIAVTNEEIDELYIAVEIGTPIEILQ
jgi:murein L,D-transpeptidase YafK